MRPERPAGVAFVWENLGPMHIDRCAAVAARLDPVPVIGIEFFTASEVYDWERPETSGIERVTLFASPSAKPGRFGRALAMVGAVRRARARWVFLCHYDRLEIILAAWILRLTGARVFAMSCSKYDDRPRYAWREAVKTLALAPFRGALASGVRSRDYMRFLGIDEACIGGEYNSLSVARMRTQTAAPPAPAGTPFAQRDFVAVARFVPKKNLATLIDAFALYRADNPGGRRLVLCGSGPLEAELRAQVDRLGLADATIFTGTLQTSAVSEVMARSLALILPSVEEQFGNVVIEAQALGLPVVVAVNCGARDLLVRTGVNGFLIEPDNPEGIAYFMGLIASDEALWTRMSHAAGASAEGGDVARFADGVEELVAKSSARRV